jgi:hypothetical protein
LTRHLSQGLLQTATLAFGKSIKTMENIDYSNWREWRADCDEGPVRRSMPPWRNPMMRAQITRLANEEILSRSSRVAARHGAASESTIGARSRKRDVFTRGPTKPALAL